MDKNVANATIQFLKRCTIQVLDMCLSPLYEELNETEAAKDEKCCSTLTDPTKEPKQEE